MRLKKLDIHGFKSFADHSVIEFDDGITGIVGPNGSGKSNIADAVRWALGEQSARQLRGGKMEDIIFAGSQIRRAMPYSEVSLVFDNEDGALSVDYNEVMVTRRVYRSGEGEYMINRAPCRLKDIIDLFRDTGIGKEGYSLIGQGRIDEILSARSEERRAVFEEAAGIVKFKARKTEAQRRLERMGLDLVRIRDITAEIETQLEPLRQKAEDARAYIDMYVKLKTLELLDFVERTGALAERAARTKEAIAQSEEALTLNAAQDGEAAALIESVQERERVLEDASARLRQEALEGARTAEAAKGALDVGREKLKSLRDQIARLEHEIQENQHRSAELILADADAESERRRAALETLRASAEDMERRTGELSSALVEREAELEREKNAMMEAINRVADAKSAAARMDAMIAGFDERAQTLRAELAALDTDEGDDGQAVESARAALSASADALKAMEAEAEALREESVRLMAVIEQGNQRTQQTLGTMREADAKLKLLLQLQRDMEGYQHPVREALKRAGTMPGGGGMRCVVAESFVTPKELEVALEMALGGSLQYIICDAEDDARRMIDILRSERLGRATFLPLSAIRPRLLSRDERAALSMPGCLGVASELVSFEEVYRPVVENLLGRTIVAEDLKRGVDIARRSRNAFRVVTTEGDVINPGGAMTGGSLRSKTSGLLSREREIEACRTSLEALNKRLDILNAEQERARTQREAVKVQQGETRERMRQQDIALTRDEERLKNAERALEERERRGEAMRDELDRLNERLEDARRQREASGDALGEENRAGEGMRERVATLSRDVLDGRRALEEARSLLSQERVREAAAEREWASAVREGERLRNRREELEGSAASLSASMEAAVTALSVQEDENARMDERAHDAATAQSSLEERIDAMERERARVREELRAAQSAREAVRERIEGERQRGHRLELSLSRTESEMEQLSARIFGEYELSLGGAAEFLKSAPEPEGDIETLRAGIRALGSVNTQAVEEYAALLERHEQLTVQTADIQRAQADLEGIITELEKKMEAQFKERFELLSRNFDETFKRLFGGGYAKLALADERDALNCEIEISAQPPGKKLQLLSLLSGGERALTAIAVLFATLMLKPTPFCILDEIEAALDEPNIQSFGRFLKEFAKDTQFIVVTHRKGTMEFCNVMYGITMQEKGVSSLMSMRLDDARERDAG